MVFYPASLEYVINLFSPWQPSSATKPWHHQIAADKVRAASADRWPWLQHEARLRGYETCALGNRLLSLGPSDCLWAKVKPRDHPALFSLYQVCLGCAWWPRHWAPSMFLASVLSGPARPHPGSAEHTLRRCLLVCGQAELSSGHCSWQGWLRDGETTAACGKGLGRQDSCSPKLPLEMLWITTLS